MSYCKNCGKKLGISEKFCSNCGKKTFKEKKLYLEFIINKLKNHKVKIKFSILFLIVFIALAAAYEPMEDWWENYQNKKLAEELEAVNNKLMARRREISNEWHNTIFKDPLTGEDYVYDATIFSENGQCALSIEKRISGTELTDLSCIGLIIYPRISVEVKFDSFDESKIIAARRYSGSSDIYLSAKNDGRVSNLKYDQFIENIRNNKTMLIRFKIGTYGNGGYSQWFRFTLKKSEEAINNVGKYLNEIKENTITYYYKE